MTEAVSDIGQFGRKGDVLLYIQCIRLSSLFCVAKIIHVDGEVYGSLLCLLIYK